MDVSGIILTEKRGSIDCREKSIEAMDVKEALLALSSAVGVGNERAAAHLAADIMKDFAGEVRVDATGSVVGKIPGQSERAVLLEAHIDEIGFIVTKVDGRFLRIANSGGIDLRVLPGCRVTVHGNRPIPGAFCSTPPHLSSGEEGYPGYDKLAIDTGLMEEELKSLVKPGDAVSFRMEPAELAGGLITGKSLDNRAGCVAVLRAAELIATCGTPPCTVYLLLASGEELGNRGAVTAAFGLEPDEALVTDVSFGLSPQSPAAKCGKLGEGAMVGVAPVLSKSVTKKLVEIAQRNDIPYQYEGMGGETSTDADVICTSREGVRCGLLSIPLRNMHTPVEIVDPADVESVARLMSSYILEGGLLNA